MAHPLKHAQSSARKFGGRAEDYLPIHNWFDESKAFLADFRHRALRHHAEGIFLAEKLFGVAIVNSDGKKVPVRYVGGNMSGRSWDAFPRRKIGSGRSNHNDGCTVRAGPKKHHQLRDGRYQHPNGHAQKDHAPAHKKCRMQNIQSYWIFSICGFPVT